MYQNYHNHHLSHHHLYHNQDHHQLTCLGNLQGARGTVHHNNHHHHLSHQHRCLKIKITIIPSLAWRTFIQLARWGLLIIILVTTTVVLVTNTNVSKPRSPSTHLLGEPSGGKIGSSTGGFGSDGNYHL